MKKDFYVVGYPDMTREELEATKDKYRQVNWGYSGTEIYIPEMKWMDWMASKKGLNEFSLVVPEVETKWIPKWTKLLQETHEREEKAGYPSLFCPVKCARIQFIYKDEFYCMYPLYFPGLNEITINEEFSLVEREIVRDLYEIGVTYAKYFDLLD